MTRLINWLIKKFNLNVSDGYHTFKELYEFRMLYNAAFFKHLFYSNFPVHKSFRHYDGELCFGGGWFIVVAELPTGVISNHYESKYWDLFHVPTFYKSITPFDGHTPQDVVERLTEYCRGPKDLAIGRNKGADFDIDRKILPPKYLATGSIDRLIDFDIDKIVELQIETHKIMKDFNSDKRQLSKVSETTLPDKVYEDMVAKPYFDKKGQVAGYYAARKPSITLPDIAGIDSIKENKDESTTL